MHQSLAALLIRTWGELQPVPPQTAQYSVSGASGVPMSSPAGF